MAQQFYDGCRQTCSQRGKLKRAVDNETTDEESWKSNICQGYFQAVIRCSIFAESTAALFVIRVIWAGDGIVVCAAGEEQKQKKCRGKTSPLSSNLSDVFTTAVSFSNLQAWRDRSVINFNSAAQFRTLNRLFYHQSRQ